MRRPKISGTIKYVMEEFFHHKRPEQIKNGWCIEFAQMVKEEHPSSIFSYELRVVSCEIAGHDIGHWRWGSHWWIHCPEQEMHYDAERPLGVEHWKALPLFNRRQYC